MKTISQQRGALYCFSPPVMLATFAIEIIFALYTVWRYRLDATARLVVAILVFLAIFQGTEFLLCGGLMLEGGVWSRIGYVSISMLPPLGLHLAYKLADKNAGALVVTSYLSAAAFIAYFAFASQAISGHTCYANYAVFDVASGLSWPYIVYYYGWMLVGTFLTFAWAPSAPAHRRRALYALLAGYLALFIPTTAINVIDQSTIAGIPSIMCGFAVILAFLLATEVSPNSLAKREIPLMRRVR